MSGYQVTLLGVPGVFYKGDAIHFPYRKAEGIFYYLCVEKKVNRDELISVFWGDGDEASGRKNLRQALFQIRRCLGSEVIVQQGKNALELNPKTGIWTEWDASDAEFAFYREKFLDFFYLKDCPEFEIWVENKRRLQISRCLDYIRARMKEPDACREESGLCRLIETWEHWKPWDEEMVLAGMKCYMQSEKYDLGIQLYYNYAKCLRNELDEEPSHEVDLLFRMLLHRKELSLKRKKAYKESFFGRLKELEYIDEQIFLFLNQEPSASVVIEGEAGVGKTSLIQQVFNMNREAGILELVSHCYSAESDFPLKSWRDLFKQLENLHNEGKIHLSEKSAGLIRFILMGMAEENPNSVCGGEGEHLNYTALEGGVLNLLKELAAQWKIILYFDSLQWMDTAGQRLLQRIMIELGNRQVFMIAARRIDEKQDIQGLLVALSERDIIATLPLSCFTEAETEEIVERTLQGCRDAGINAHEIFLRTEGNPLVLMDMLNMIRQEGWKDDRPLPRIDRLIQLWLEKLTKQQRRVLNALSIYVECARLEELEPLMEMGRLELLEELEQLLLTRFVIEEARDGYVVYKFRHRFYRDYIYRHLSMGKKQLWHYTAAQFCEKQTDGEKRLGPR